MKTRAPSPALVISFVALFVALSATAFAATRITSSTQIKRGVVTGSDIKNGSIRGVDIAKKTIKESNLAKSALKSVGGGAGSGESAIEVVRKAGPDTQPAHQMSKVIEMTLPAGAWVISSTVTQYAFPKTGLLVQPVDMAHGTCILDAAGDTDVSNETVAVKQISAAGRHKMQTTRTVGGPSKVEVNCSAGVLWSTSNSSIVAIKVGKLSKSGS